MSLTGFQTQGADAFRSRAVLAFIKLFQFSFKCCEFFRFLVLTELLVTDIIKLSLNSLPRVRYFGSDATFSNTLSSGVQWYDIL